VKAYDYIVWRLAREGIRKVFLVQGAANNDLIYALADRAPEIDYVCTVHEQAAGFAAEGYAKVTGGLGVALATSGPGGQNLLTCVANCYYDSVPVLFLTGQVNSRFLRPDPAIRQLGFQECDIVAMARPVTKHAELVLTAAAVPVALEVAIRFCLTGRRGPCLLDLPIDVQRGDVGGGDDPARICCDASERARLLTWAPYNTNLTAIAQHFVDQFTRAQRPVLLVGGGVRDVRAITALDAALEKLRCPAFPTWNALDVVTSDHPWYGGRVGTYGGPGRNLAVQNSDLLLAMGCRLSGRITGGAPQTFARNARRWVVDVDPALLRMEWQPQPFHECVHTDAASFLEAVADAIRTIKRTDTLPLPWERIHAAWWQRVQAWRDRYDPVDNMPGTDNVAHPYRFIQILSAALPANAIVVYDCGGNAVVVAHAFKTKRGQRVFSNHGNSPMGFAFAAALGAWFAEPERPVFCIIGDGGFCMNVQELATVKTYNIPLKTVIIDNHCYGITKAFQERHYPGRYEACGPKGYQPPDFTQVVRAYGTHNVWTVREDAEAEATIADLVVWPEAVVCVLHCPDYHEYAPRIEGWDTPIEDMTPLLCANLPDNERDRHGKAK